MKQKINIENICHLCRVLGGHEACQEPCDEWWEILLGVNKDWCPVYSNVGNSNANNGAFNCNANNDWSNTNGVRKC